MPYHMSREFVEARNEELRELTEKYPEMVRLAESLGLLDRPVKCTTHADGSVTVWDD